MEGGGSRHVGAREAVATCTGERADSQTAPAREQTENMSRGMRASPDFSRSSSVLTGNKLRPGATGVRGGGWRLAADGVRNTKDRDAPALEVRAGTPGVGRTSRDAARLSSTNRNRVQVARSSENGPRSPLFCDRG